MPNFQDYLQMFADLNVDKSHGDISPHKPCLLLAVIDLVESGAITDGRVRFTLALREIFSEYFAIVAKPKHHDRPHIPFYYLDSDPFWTITVKTGRESDFKRITTPSHRQVEDYTEYAEIDLELFKYMRSSSNREAMREQLIRCWLPDHRKALNEKIAFCRESNSYERTLRGTVASVPVVRDAPSVPGAQDSVFRRLVLEAYDYRCAASGWRLIVPGNRILVQAVHLIPHSESQDDDPRNGIALTPNFHWALDHHIIAPGPDLKWHISRALDEHIADNQPLLALRGKDVIVPSKQSMRPREDALEWRLERLLA